jgi:hypothetical protein
MIINDLASLKEDKDSVDEKICLRCWVPHKEIKREWSNWCSSRWHYYPKHLYRERKTPTSLVSEM